MWKSHRALALILALACVAGSALAQNSGKGAVAYRWVDEHGVVHYGDTVPPQYARNSRQILNSEGVEIGHIDAEKTPAQLAGEAQRARAARARSSSTTTFFSVPIPR